MSSPVLSRPEKLGLQIKLVFGQISVEPLLFSFYLSFCIFQAAAFPAFYQKVCIHVFNKDPLECQNINNNETLSDLVQQQASYWIMYIEVAKFFPKFIATMLLGSFADHHGRKTPMVLGLFSMCWYQAAYLAMVMTPQVPLYSFMLLVLVNAWLPFLAIAVMTTFSYLADVIKDQETLTFRYTVLTAFWSLAFVIGNYVSSILLENMSLDYVMLVGQSLSLIPFIGTLLLFPNKPTTPKKAEKELSMVKECLSLVKSAIKCLRRPRSNNGRLHISLICIVMVIYASEDAGLDAIISIFAFGPILQWQPDQLSRYYAVMSLLQMLGSLLGANVLKRLGFRDTTVACLGVLSGCFKMGFLAIVGFSPGYSWLMYFGLIPGCLSTVGYPALRAFVVRLGHRDEAGELIGLLTVISGLYPLFSTAVYNNLYAATVALNPGITFAFAASLLFLCFLVILGIHFDRERLSEISKL